MRLHYMIQALLGVIIFVLLFVPFSLFLNDIRSYRTFIKDNAALIIGEDEQKAGRTEMLKNQLSPTATYVGIGFWILVLALFYFYYTRSKKHLAAYGKLVENIEVYLGKAGDSPDSRNYGALENALNGWIDNIKKQGCAWTDYRNSPTSITYWSPNVDPYPRYEGGGGSVGGSSAGFRFAGVPF